MPCVLWPYSLFWPHHYSILYFCHILYRCRMLLTIRQYSLYLALKYTFKCWDTPDALIDYNWEQVFWWTIFFYKLIFVSIMMYWKTMAKNVFQCASRYQVFEKLFWKPREDTSQRSSWNQMLNGIYQGQHTSSMLFLLRSNLSLTSTRMGFRKIPSLWDSALKIERTCV